MYNSCMPVKLYTEYNNQAIYQILTILYLPQSSTTPYLGSIYHSQAKYQILAMHHLPQPSKIPNLGNAVFTTAKQYTKSWQYCIYHSQAIHQILAICTRAKQNTKSWQCRIYHIQPIHQILAKYQISAMQYLPHPNNTPNLDQNTKSWHFASAFVDPAGLSNGSQSALFFFTVTHCLT